MTAASPGRCRVLDAERLPPDIGEQTICAAVERAVGASAPGVRYEAEVRVVSRSGLVANIVADGKRLDGFKFAVSDRELNPRSIERFAQSVAAAIARSRS